MSGICAWLKKMFFLSDSQVRRSKIVWSRETNYLQLVETVGSLYPIDQLMD